MVEAEEGLLQKLTEYMYLLLFGKDVIRTGMKNVETVFASYAPKRHLPVTSKFKLIDPVQLR